MPKYRVRDRIDVLDRNVESPREQSLRLAGGDQALAGSRACSPGDVLLDEVRSSLAGLFIDSCFSDQAHGVLDHWLSNRNPAHDLLYIRDGLLAENRAGEGLLFLRSLADDVVLFVAAGIVDENFEEKILNMIK